MNDPRLYDPSRDVSAEAAAHAAEVSGAAADVQDALHQMEAKRIADAIESGKKAFVFPQRRNYRKLVKAGTLQACFSGTHTPIPSGVRADNPEIARVGDIWLHAKGGILIFDPEEEGGQEILAWCLEHPEICRDALDPQTEVWAHLKTSQTQFKNKAPSMSQGLDVDAMMRGDYTSAMENDSLVSQARRQLEANAAAKA